MTGSTQVWTPLDFEADGKQCDWLRVPHSTDLSGYGVVPIPIVCIRNGAGPTALLVGGNHGDEYEGQVALARLCREIEAADVRGRIIILPSLNTPAVEAGRRVSPLDDGNLNRSFPGDPVGGPTAMIAHYVTTVLLAMADVAIDLHAGGRSCHYLPCALIRSGGGADENRELTDLATAFAAPITSISDGSGGGGMTTFSAAGQGLGVPVLTAELGVGPPSRGRALPLQSKGCGVSYSVMEFCKARIPALHRPPASCACGAGAPSSMRCARACSSRRRVWARSCKLASSLGSFTPSIGRGKRRNRSHSPKEAWLPAGARRC